MADMILKGSVHKYGANVNTDEIIPARYLTTSDPKELAKYCMKDIDDTFAKTVKTGDIIVADKSNFIVFLKPLKLVTLNSFNIITSPYYNVKTICP